MRIILHKYILREIISFFIVSLLVFVFIALAREMLIITEWIVQYDVSLYNLVYMVICLIPETILYALPAATLISVIIAFTRFSVDNEIIALKSAGTSLYQLMPPVLAFALLACLIGLTISLYAGPLGGKTFREISINILKSTTNIGLKERVFFEPVEDVYFYINNISYEDNMMSDVFIFDKRDDKRMTYTIVATKGQLILPKEAKDLNFHLEDGNIFIAERGLSAVRSIRFKTYDFKIDLEEMIPAKSGGEKEPQEMFMAELLEHRRQAGGSSSDAMRYNEATLEMMERFSIPLAVFLIGLIGVPLGSQIKARGRLAGGVLGLGVFLMYYICWAGFRSLSEAGLLSPVAGPWIPPLLLLVSGVYLMRRAARERPLLPLGRRAYPPSRMQPKASVS